jgi:cytoskeletal protein CcmA (bactofilin family)
MPLDTSQYLAIGGSEGDPADRAKLFYHDKNWLSTDGSLTIDQGDQNIGTLNPNASAEQSPGLIFGKSGGEGIASQRIGEGSKNGLNFYTNSTVRLSITNAGDVSVGTNSTPGSLTVTGATTTKTLTVQQAVTVGDVTAPANLTVNGTANITGSITVGSPITPASLVVNGNVGIGMTPASEKLEVDGNVLVNGDLYLKQNNFVSLHYGNRGRLGQTPDFNPDTDQNGLWLEASTDGGESGGLFCNGNTIVLWSPGDNDTLRVYDEDSFTSPQFVINSVGNVGIGTPSPQSKLDVNGEIRAGNSDIYFTKTDHVHTGIGNTAGFAAIENASNYNALMILGRAGTPKGRAVKLWDYLEVNGEHRVNGRLIAGSLNASSHIFQYTGDIWAYAWNDTEYPVYIWFNHASRAAFEVFIWFELIDLSYGEYDRRQGKATITIVNQEDSRVQARLTVKNCYAKFVYHALCVRK